MVLCILSVGRVSLLCLGRLVSLHNLLVVRIGFYLIGSRRSNALVIH